jgi:hypothetical protein
MKKLLASLLLTTVCLASQAQSDETVTKAENIRPAALGVSFVLYDYRTAQLIRNSTLSTVLNKKQFGKPKEMSPGLAVSYFKGLRKNIDLAATASGVFADVALEDRKSGEDFQFQVDASLNLKMLPENFFFTPYLNVGLGASIYDSKFGAFIPLGAGLKFNLFNEAAIFINSQYRVPVTTSSVGYHFYHGIGIAGIIGK